MYIGRVEIHTWKSSADDSRLLNQDLELYGNQKPWFNDENSHCQHQLVRSGCESGCPVGRSGRGHPGAWLLVFHCEQKPRNLGASLLLFSCIGKVRNDLRYRGILRKQQLCKHIFQLVCSRWAVSVGGSVEPGNRLSLCYLMLYDLPMCCSRQEIMLGDIYWSSWIWLLQREVRCLHCIMFLYRKEQLQKHYDPQGLQMHLLFFCLPPWRTFFL